MKKNTLLVLLLLMSTINYSQETTEDSKSPKPNYRLAARFSPTKVGKLVHSTSVWPRWLKRGNRFWYQYKTTKGSKYYLVDADSKKRTVLFDNAKMAKWLSEITKDAYDAQHLPRFNFKFVKNETAIRFRVTSEEMVPVKEEKKDEKKEDEKKVEDEKKEEGDKKEKKKVKKKKPKMEKKVYHLEYVLGGNKLTIVDNEKEKKKEWQKWANVAPDSSIVLYSKNYNLHWMDKENFLKAVKNEKDTTIVENQWTKDGEENFGYGGSTWGENNETKAKNKDKKKRVRVMWTRDSKKFVVQRTDSRMIKDLWVINSVSKKRPTLETYKYHMPGEQEFYKNEMKVFDVPSKDILKVKLDTVAQQSVYAFPAPTKKSINRDELNPTYLLSKKGKIYFQTVSRDRKRLDIHVADINTGDVKTLIEEHSNVYIENQYEIHLFNNESEIVHWSERDGWGHFYLYSSDGKLKQQITSGPFHAESYEGIDEKSRTLLFTANGVSKDIDPYYSHLYKINLNGTGMRTLNAGDFNTRVNVSDSNKYFVSNFSRVNTVPKSELRNSSGSLVMNLEEADLSELFATGYKFPEPFKVKADDGITDIYGIMYKPFDFDETKKYPLIEYVYPGPQTEAVNTSFSTWMNPTDRMAQVGFIVVTLGNRGGHSLRSKWYHTYGYGNLRDYGLADKKYVAEQLADRHSFINLDKVGIYGHSGGGFMSTAAMLVYPDFFHAAVSSAGNHDNNIYNSWWSETHHGVKEEKDADGKISYKYQIDKNQTLAKNLKGKLMLVTGDVDNNVHPGGTIRMANALIKANKRFDFMIMPGQRHGFGSMTEYFFWLKADYFSKHLLGVEMNDVDLKVINKDKPKR